MFTVNRKVKPETYYFHDDGKVPNSHLPVLLYRKALEITFCTTGSGLKTTRSQLAQDAECNGWRIAWSRENAVFPDRQYCSWAHGVLVGLRSTSTLQFGSGKKSKDLAINAGDMIAIPAGVAYKSVTLEKSLFFVVALYPKGQRWNVCRTPESYQQAKDQLSRVRLPTTDPIFGIGGPLIKHWVPFSRTARYT